MLFALPENFRLGGKCLRLTNPLAYCDSELIIGTNKVAAPFAGMELVTKKKKSFIRLNRGRRSLEDRSSNFEVI